MVILNTVNIIVRSLYLFFLLIALKLFEKFEVLKKTFQIIKSQNNKNKNSKFDILNFVDTKFKIFSLKSSLNSSKESLNFDLNYYNLL